MIRINNKTKLNQDVQTFLTIGEDIFQKAKKYLSKAGNVEYKSISVIDQDGRYLFALELHNDMLFNVNQTGTIYMLEELSNIENIDYMLFKDIDIVVYYELEEYTYTICRLLQKKFPGIEHIFLDKNADLLLENIFIFESLSEAESFISQQKCIYIRSDGWNAVGPGLPCDYVSCIYNSINVMKSLLWVQKHNTFGVKNKGRTIFLIDTGVDDVGLVDIIKLVCYYRNIAFDHGWIPVVKLDCFPNQYLQKEGENMWEYFFEPISEISVSEALESYDVISMRENRQLFHQVEINPFVRKYSQIMVDNSFLRNNFSLNKETISYIKRYLPIQFLNASFKILGVIMRGTDYRSEPVKKRGEKDINALPIDVINRIHELEKKWNYDYIFVATEDIEYFEIFRHEFGNKMLFIEQKRAYYCEDAVEKSVSELLEVKGDLDFAKRYLTVIYTLSKCNALIVSRNCGASRLARSWNRTGYEIDEVVGKR